MICARRARGLASFDRTCEIFPYKSLDSIVDFNGHDGHRPNEREILALAKIVADGSRIVMLDVPSGMRQVMAQGLRAHAAIQGFGVIDAVSDVSAQHRP